MTEEKWAATPRAFPLATILRDMLAVMAEYVPQDSKPWVRTFTMLFFGSLCVIMLTLMGPFVLVRSLVRPRQDPVELLKVEVQTVWETDSPHAGMEVLRRVHRQLLARYQRGRMGRTHIRPYGKMGLREFLEVSWYRYHGEMELGEYDGAIETCDALLSCRAGSEIVDEDWTVMKARAISRRDGRGPALEYLVSLRSPKGRWPKIEEYLESLRSGRAQ